MRSNTLVSVVVSSVLFATGRRHDGNATALRSLVGWPNTNAPLAQAFSFAFSALTNPPGMPMSHMATVLELPWLVCSAIEPFMPS